MRILAIMSGSSLDGVDLATVVFEEKNGFSWNLEYTQSYDLDENLKRDLKDIVERSVQDLAVIQFHYTSFIGNCIAQFNSEFKCEFDYCSIHGHTVLHAPEIMTSWQLLNPGMLSSMCKMHIVTDFRNQDMGAGGIGTPMAALIDKDLFSEFDYCINLGGIANISFMDDENLFAFDIAPCNQVHNYYAQKSGLEYDISGQLASKGKFVEEMYMAMMKIDIPKAIDNSWIKDMWIPFLEGFQEKNDDVLFTHYKFLVQLISNIVTKKKSKVLLSGGGAKNQYFVECLSIGIKDRAEVCLPDEILIDFKECILMAYLAYKRIKRESNFLKECTGADVSVCGGAIYYYTNK